MSNSDDDNSVYFTTHRACLFCRYDLGKYNIEVGGITKFRGYGRKPETTYRCSMGLHEITLEELQKCHTYSKSRIAAGQLFDSIEIDKEHHDP